MNKMIESGSIKQDRNQIARQKLSAKINKRSDDQQHIPTPSNPGSLWSDPDIQRTIDCLSPEDRYKASMIGEELFKKDGFVDSISAPIRRDPNSAVFESASQIQTMLRDGLLPEELSDDEKRTLISVIGPDEAQEKYGLSLPDEVIKVSHLQENGKQTVGDSISNNSRTHKRTKKGPRKPKRTGETASIGVDRISQSNR
jgi:hypothetical protein